jgi:hypothetical protein
MEHLHGESEVCAFMVPAFSALKLVATPLPGLRPGL